MFQKRLPEREKEIAEQLLDLYIHLRRQTIGGYRLSRKKNFPRFEALAKLIVAHRLSPQDYMRFAIEFYGPNPYVNMVTSQKGIAAFMAKEDTSSETDDMLDWELRTLKSYQECYPALPLHRIASHFVGQVTPLTLYCYLIQAGGDNSAAKYEEEAREAWFLSNDNKKHHYCFVFPKIKIQFE